MAAGPTRWPRRGAEQRRGPAVAQELTPDDLLRRAVRIRDLLDDTDADDHATRIRLVAALDGVHLEAARQWHARGWRPITEAVVAARDTASLLRPPALVGAAAAVIAVRWLGTPGWLAVLLALLAAGPWLVERAGLGEQRLRLAAAAGAAALTVHLLTGTMPATLVFLPALTLLTAIALLGTVPRPVGVPDRRNR